MQTYGQELNVYLEILYNEDSEKFIVGYGAFENRPTSVGVDDSLAGAFESVGENIGSGATRRIRLTLNKGSETSLETKLFHSSEYTVVVEDCAGNTVSGSGRNMSIAFADLSEVVADQINS